MTPQQALNTLALATEVLHPDLRLTMRTDDGREVVVNAQSRGLHQAISEAVRVLQNIINEELEATKDAQPE